MRTIDIVNYMDIEVCYVDEDIGGHKITGTVYVEIHGDGLHGFVDDGPMPTLYTGRDLLPETALGAVWQHTIQAVMEWMQDPQIRHKILTRRVFAARDTLRLWTEDYEKAVKHCADLAAKVATASTAITDAETQLAQEFPDSTQETIPR